MNKAKLAGLSLMVLALFFLGFNFNSILKLAPEDKINSAIPVPDAVLNVKTAVMNLAKDSRRHELEKQLEARLKLRALNCAKGYSPSWLTSREVIQKNLEDHSCFADADREITKWLGFVRVGLILAEPPLRPVPAKSPDFIVGDGNILDSRFSRKAGIALIQTPQSVEVVDFDGSKPIFKEPRGSGMLGELSANGRLFTFVDGSKVKIRASETGDDIAEIPSGHTNQYFWIDEHTSTYSDNAGKAFLVDLVSGKEIPIDVSSQGVLFVAKVPGKENQFVLFSPTSATKIELDRTKAEPEVRVVGDQQIKGNFWRGNMPSITADGNRVFSVSPNLTLLTLDSLEMETIPFEPFHIQSAIATPDPDKLLLYGFTTMATGQGTKYYLFSVSTQTLTPVDSQTKNYVRYVYIPSIQKQAEISENKIAIIDKLPALEPISLSQFVNDVQQEANQAKLDAFDRQQQLMLQGGYQGWAGARGYSSPVWAPEAAAPIPAPAAPAPESIRSSSGQSASSVIANLTRGAQIESIGVYQGPRGRTRTADGRNMGVIDVTVRRTSKPIILVLCSYEPVQWKLKIEPGAKLNAVLVSGYYTSQVSGAGSARVVLTGSTYAYSQGGPEFRRFNQEIMLWTGRTIDVFQGKYEGSTFSVGG